MNIADRIIEAQHIQANYATVTERVTVEVQANQVKAGDILDGVVVREKTAGRLNASIFLVDRATPQRLPLEQTVEVVRDVETEASKQMKRDLYMQVVRLRALRDGAVAVDYTAKIAEQLEKGYMDRVAEYAIDAAAEAVVTRQFAGAVRAVEADRLSVDEAIAEVKQTLTDEVLNDQDSPTWSGGFSVTNTVNQAKQSARRRALQNLRWTGL